MALQNDTSRIQYNGNNSTTNSYAIPFVFFENSHIKCVVTTSAGVDTELALGSTFNVTGAGNQNGGSLTTTTAVPTSSKVTIFRNVPATQTTSYQEGGDFPAASHERALDKLTMISQQAQRQINNTLRFSEASQLTPINPPVSATPHVLTSVSGGQPTWETMDSVNITPSLNNLTDATTVNANDEVIIQQGGISRRATANELLNGSAALIASGSSVGRTLKDRFADAVNVKDFGAVGNNSADDGPAIRAAIAYAVDNGKSVYFPKATYLISTTTTGATMPLTLAGDCVRIWNQTSTVKQVAIIGDGATIRTTLYPTIYTGQFNIGYGAYQILNFFSIIGNFDKIEISGLTLFSDRPLQQGNQWNSPPLTTTVNGSVLAANPSPTQAHGRVYGIYLSDNNLGRLKNVEINNNTFIDHQIPVQIVDATNVNVSNCSFIYRYGQTSVGDSDWSVGIGVRDCNGLRVVNNYFNGHLENDADPPSSTYTGKRCADGFILTTGSASIETNNLVISNNVIRRFGREGILVNGRYGRTPTSAGVPPALVSGNWLDGRYPQNHDPSITNWSIVSASSHTHIVGNVSYMAIVGILYNAYGGYWGGYGLVNNNYITLSDSNYSPSQAPTGIAFGLDGDEAFVTGNYVFAADVKAGTISGWNGTTFGHGAGSANPALIIPRALAFNGGVSNNKFQGQSVSRLHVKNNVFKCVSKGANTFTVAIEGGGNNGYILSENNIYDGWDFLGYKQGGGTTGILSKNDSIRNFKRLNSGYIAELYDNFQVVDGMFDFYPTSTGWYEIILKPRRVFGGRLTIAAEGEMRYGDTTLAANSATAYQYTQLNISSWSDGSQTATERWTLSQRHSSGVSPAVTKAYIRLSNTSTNVFVYVAKVLSKIELTFSGGGGSNAAGHANVANGVITSVTMTNNGSGYTSAPTVSISEPIVFQIVGSGATFTAVLSSNTVGSVTVGGSGGSGYSQPLRLKYESSEGDNVTSSNGIMSWMKPSNAPSNGTEIVFRQGERSVSQNGYNTPLIGAGDPIASVVLSATGVAATDLITATGHPFANGDQIGFQSITGGEGLTDGTTYFVRDVAGNDFKVAATSGGAAINFTTDISAATIVPVMPEFIGQQFIDTTNNKIYVATGTAGGKWALLN